MAEASKVELRLDGDVDHVLNLDQTRAGKCMDNRSYELNCEPAMSGWENRRYNRNDTEYKVARRILSRIGT